jgi:hypothetical protein
MTLFVGADWIDSSSPPFERGQKSASVSAFEWTRPMATEARGRLINDEPLRMRGRPKHSLCRAHAVIAHSHTTDKYRCSGSITMSPHTNIERNNERLGDLA